LYSYDPIYIIWGLAPEYATSWNGEKHTPNEGYVIKDIVKYYENVNANYFNTRALSCAYLGKSEYLLQLRLHGFLNYAYITILRGIMKP
jgi:hypothetical protein